MLKYFSLKKSLKLFNIATACFVVVVVVVFGGTRI
jgi:hypothetical protein